MQNRSAFTEPTVGMISTRLVAAAIVLVLGSALGSCSPFAGYVSDHWPHWAGGMPADVPPRPGAPGYEEFIAHGQADQDAAKAATTGDAKSVATGEKPIGPTFKTTAQPAPAPPAAPPGSRGAPGDPSIVQGGLY